MFKATIRVAAAVGLLAARDFMDRRAFRRAGARKVSDSGSELRPMVSAAAGIPTCEAST
jgi:hypothetical protein